MIGSATCARNMVDVGNLGSPKISIKNTADFELDLKKKLKWNKSNWISSGESGTRINKLVNSMHYWKQRLKPAFEETSIVFTIFNDSQDFKTNIALIILAIESLDSSIHVEGFSSFRNPRYLCIYLNSKKDRDFVHENFRMYNEGYVVYLDWALETADNVSELKVHWLPMTFSLDIIEKELSEYVFFLENIREGLKMMLGREVPSGMVTFKVKLKEGVRAVDVPHTAVIGGMEALLTMPGRQPLCLNCATLGHISKYCKLRYCKKCSSLQEKVHDCCALGQKTTYALAVKGDGLDTNDVISDDEEAAFTEEVKDVQNIGTNLGLVNKISDLEKQIITFKTETDELTSAMESVTAKEQINSNCTLLNVDKEKEFCKSYKMESEDDSSCSDKPEDSTAVQVELQGAHSGQKDESLQNQNFQKVSKRKRKKKNTEGLIVGSGARNIDSTSLNVIMRSYGRPNYGNQRRLKAEKDYQKSCSKSPDHREYIFTDPIINK